MEQFTLVTDGPTDRHRHGGRNNRLNAFSVIPVKLKVKLLKLNNYRHTSAMALRAVSAPRVKSVPGTLLLMVAGIIVIGIQNSGNLSRASAIANIL